MPRTGRIAAAKILETQRGEYVVIRRVHELKDFTGCRLGAHAERIDHANKGAMDSCIASAYGMDEKDKVDLIELLHE